MELFLLIVLIGGGVWIFTTVIEAPRQLEKKAEQLEAQGKDSSGVACASLLIIVALFALAGVGVVIAKATPGFLP